MGRRKTNRYRLVSPGLKIETSLDLEWCNRATEKQMIEVILATHRLPTCLENFRNGTRKVELIPIRVHKEANP